VVDIFDEVSEDLRHDRAVSVAKRYGGFLIIAMVLTLIGVGAEQAYTAHKAKLAEAAATQYLALAQSADQQGAQMPPDQAVQAAQALNKFAAHAPEGYKTLANLRAAGLYAAAGKIGQANALWTGVAQDGGADKLLRDLATLLWAQHALGAVPDTDIQARLQPLSSTANPYHALAQELEALTYLHQGNPSLAKAVFSGLAADPTAPAGVRQRAQGLLAQLNG
jgi:hypothetical protein